MFQLCNYKPHITVPSGFLDFCQTKSIKFHNIQKELAIFPKFAADYLQIRAETCRVTSSQHSLFDSRASNMNTAIIESNYISLFTGRS